MTIKLFKKYINVESLFCKDFIHAYFHLHITEL